LPNPGSHPPRAAHHAQDHQTAWNGQITSTKSGSIRPIAASWPATSRTRFSLALAQARPGPDAARGTSNYWVRAATGSLFRLVDAGPRRVAAPGRPPGELGGLRVDADQAAVFGANIDPAALDHRLRAHRAADRPALRDLAGLGVQAPDLACRSADEDRVARGRRRGHQRAAELGHVAVDLALPAGFAGLVVGAYDLVAHRRDQILLERQHARPLVRLHARDAPLADIALRRGGVGGDRSAAPEPVHRVERFGLLGVGGFLLDFLVEILRFLFLE